jgi:DNA-binding NarL/FixJ family response regulator
MRIKPYTAIVVEDQPITWDYIRSCLDDLCEIKAFCLNTKQAEEAFHLHKPDFVWLDCYLGEISENSLGLRNSGLQIASWMKSHNPNTKIFLFTAAGDMSIFRMAKSLQVEGIALGGKFLRDKSLVIEGIEKVLNGGHWISPNVFENFELDTLDKITVFELCVIASMILGKNTAQIAEELDTTRKRVNNAIYRVKEKLKLEHDLSREDFLEIVKDEIKSGFDFNSYYNVSDLLAINSLLQHCLSPVIEQLKTGELDRKNLGSLLKD